jgi:membrane-associated phospholipid phosphatase
MNAARPTSDSALQRRSPTSRASGSELEQIPALAPRADGPAVEIADYLDHRRPSVVFATTALLGYLGLVAVAIGLGYLLTHLILQWHTLAADDERVASWFARERTPTLDDVSYVGSMAGDIPVLPGLVVLAVIVFAWVRRFLAAAFVATAGILELATYRVTSLVIHRDRPHVLRMDNLPVHQSYPSGHVAASIAVYGALALVVSSLARRRWVSIVAWSLAILLPIAVAVSRVYRGMHHPTDVVAGVLVGIGALLVALLAARACAAVLRRRSTSTIVEEIS